MFKKLLIGAVCIFLIGLLAGYFARNMIVESAVESGGEYALGVENNLGSANLDFAGGSLSLDSYQIDNPEGFEKDFFLEIRKGVLDIESGSVFEDEVVIDSMILEGLTLNFEQIDSKGNYKQILDHIQKLDFGSSDDDADESELLMKIKKVAIRDVEVSASLTALGKQLYDKSFKIDNISLTDIGGSTGADVGEITAIIIRRITKEALSKGKGILPEGFAIDLKNKASEKLRDIGSEAKDKLKDLGGSLLKGTK